MKERPIIFDAESVRAILDGRKTQTRRVIKPQPETNQHGYLCGWWLRKPLGGLLLPKIEDIVMDCPYGAPGDKLWVREAWGMAGGGRNTHIVYRADVADNPGGWYSPIYMPRVNSRITLEITGVRVERLQAISEDDARAEGYDDRHEYEQCRDWFEERWDALNAKRGYSWSSNPWVWVVEFRRVTP